MAGDGHRALLLRSAGSAAATPTIGPQGSYISYSLLGATASYLPVMSLLAGYLGYNNMVPTAASQNSGTNCSRLL